MFLFIRLIFCFVIIYPFCEITLAADSDGDFIVVNDNNVTNFVGNNLNNGDGCWYLLESFANVSANFTFCAITNARPITLCQGCVTPYVLAVEVHKDILKLMNEVGELCKEKLLNLDRLQVVEGGIGYISGLWKRAACDLCYETDAEGLPTKLKSNVKKLTDLHNQTITCIQNHMENDTDSSNRRTIYDRQVCTECKSLYLELNSEYNHFKDESPFCMDIIDMVNTTRNLWSVTLGCCLDRQKPELTFIISSGIISVLPVLFYLIACRFTGKKEHTVVINKNSSTSHCNNMQQSDCDTTVSPGPSSDHEFTEKTVLINAETLTH